MEIFDQHGFDVLQTLGINRSAHVPESVVLVYASTSLHPYVDEQDTLTLRLRGNALPSASVLIELTYAVGA